MRKLICISDMHVGSRLAVAPAKYTTKEGVPIALSEAQKKLLGYWRQWIKFADPQPKDVVLLVGDICDGNNRAENGKNLSTVELEEQVEMSELLLKPFAGCTVIGVSGTPYHTGKEVDCDSLVTKRLGGTHCGTIANQPVKVPGGKRVVQFRHGSGGSMMYKSTTLDRESLFLDALEGSDDIDFHVDLLVKGHIHYHQVLKVKNRTLVTLPCWKLFFPFKGAENYAKFIPHIGGVVITMDDEKIHVDEKLFPYIPVIDALREVA